MPNESFTCIFDVKSVPNPKNIKEIELELNHSDIFLDAIIKLISSLNTNMSVTDVAVIPDKHVPLTYAEIRLTIEEIFKFFGTLRFIIINRKNIEAPNLLTIGKKFATNMLPLERQSSTLSSLNPPPPPPPPKHTTPKDPKTLRRGIMGELKTLFQKRAALPEDEDYHFYGPTNTAYSPPPPPGTAAPVGGSTFSEGLKDETEQELNRLRKIMRPDSFSDYPKPPSGSPSEPSIAPPLLPPSGSPSGPPSSPPSGPPKGPSSPRDKAASTLFSMLATDDIKDEPPNPLEHLIVSAPHTSQPIPYTQGLLEDERNFVKEAPPISLDTEKEIVSKDSPKAYHKNIAIDYFDRMNPDKFYPIVVNLADIEQAKKKIEDNILTGERKIQTKDEMEVLLKSPKVTVMPVFPGCSITPPMMLTDFTKKEDEVKFYCTPGIKGKIESYINFLNNEGEIVYSVETPAKIDDPRYAKSIAAYGTGVSVLPKAFTLFGLTLSVAITNIIAIIGVAVAFITGSIVFKLRQPNATKKKISLAEIGNSFLSEMNLEKVESKVK
jgi:hypothetical protein